MTYEPLHHKYRPQTFTDLVGQEAIATTLSNAIRKAKIAPAYLFTGSRGTGKTSSARILAKSLNCLKSHVPTEHPCGACEVCRAIASGSALDIIEIDAASNTGVDNIRDLIEKAQFAPVQCRYKVYIIDESHMLSTAAFNALLKTLEEPPPRVVFVLATTDPQRVLPTIISRCQRFDFRRIAVEAMVQHLKKIATKENINITDDAITLVAQVAQGGLRDAESLLDQLSLIAGEVTVEKVWDLVGSVPEQDLMALLQAIASNNPEAILSRARHLIDRGREPLMVLQNLASFYRDLLIAKTAPRRSDLVAMTSTTWKALCEEALNWDTNTILAGTKHLKDSEAQVKNTTQPRLWLEVTLLGLLPSALALPNTVSAKLHPQNSLPVTEKRELPPSYAPEVSQKPEVQPPATPAQNPTNDISQPETPKEQVLKPLPTPNQTEQPEQNTSVSEPAELSAEQAFLQDTWQKVVEHIAQASTRALLSQLCSLIEFNGQEARIGVPANWRDHLLKSVSNIQEAFEKALKAQVKVKIEGLQTNQNNTASTKKSRDRSFASKTSPSQTPSNMPPKVSLKPETSLPPKPPTQPQQPQVSKFPDPEVELVESAARSLAKSFAGEIFFMEDEIMSEAYYEQIPSEETLDFADELEIAPQDREDDDLDF